ncbi:hypothetical protein ACZ90_50200 [Streptomyces albus subsp. albus]|nr:hypothetical protein ACZ90_50200 [Streptomyces albus subsp. albus]
MSIKVSVIVPTHNTGKTVLDGLTSFREQTLPRSEFEVLYVDDGSTDDTPELLASELAGEENFRLIRSENSGWPGRPRNLGMDAARGTYLHFVDDDDYLAPQALARLYARAVETGADIVAGRMAGHGRGAPRVLFSRPMAAGDIRRDTVLLSSMTVHKLFRRELLTAHGIRFPEGRVRLEDHMFMLRAYLAAGKVATVHDYTCYHWVRHEDGKHNISFARIDPRSYLDSVRKIIEIVHEHLEPGPLRNRFIAHWYAGKALERLQGEKFLNKPPGYRSQVVAAVSSLAAELVPPEVDAALPAKQRIMSALVRHGDPALLEEYAAFESGITHRPRLEGLRWQDGRLLVRFSTELVRPGGRHGPVPVLFDRTGGRYRWQLPPSVAAVPGVAEAADFTAEVPRGKAAGQLRHREEATELLLPAGCRITDFPAADPRVRPAAAPALGRASRLGRLLRRRIPVAALDSAADTRGEVDEEFADTALGPALYGVRFEGEFTVDPATADQGRALHGVWDAHVRLDCCGWTAARRLGAERNIGVDTERMPAFFRSGERLAFANPYWTSPHSNLSLSVEGSLDPLNRAVRDTSRITATERDGVLSAEIPMTLAPLDEEVPVTVRLERPGAPPLRLPGARIAPRPGLPALLLDVPLRQLAQELGAEPAQLHIERGGRDGRLGLSLRADPATGRWTITR